MDHSINCAGISLCCVDEYHTRIFKHGVEETLYENYEKHGKDTNSEGTFLLFIVPLQVLNQSAEGFPGACVPLLSLDFIDEFSSLQLDV